MRAGSSLGLQAAEHKETRQKPFLGLKAASPAPPQPQNQQDVARRGWLALVEGQRARPVGRGGGKGDAAGGSPVRCWCWSRSPGGRIPCMLPDPSAGAGWSPCSVPFWTPPCPVPMPSAIWGSPCTQCQCPGLFFSPPVARTKACGSFGAGANAQCPGLCWCWSWCQCRCWCPVLVPAPGAAANTRSLVPVPGTGASAQCPVPVPSPSASTQYSCSSPVPGTSTADTDAQMRVPSASSNTQCPVPEPGTGTDAWCWCPVPGAQNWYQYQYWCQCQHPVPGARTWYWC